MKNVAIAMLVCFVAFVAISIRSEMRGVGPIDYGGGYESKVPPPPKPKPVEVVDEAPASTFVQERLGEPMPVDPIPVTPPPTTVTSVNASAATGDEVAIVGGPEGVTIVHQERRRPMLSGGFGRPD